MIHGFKELLGAFVCCVAAMVAQCDAQQEIEQERKSVVAKKAKKALETFHSNANFPGGSLAIVLADKSCLTATVGSASRDEHRPIERGDLFMSGSIGKTYFAAIAVDLILEKRLSADDKVSKYLGDQKWFARIPNSDELTVSSLLRHQSGLPRYIQNRELWSDVLKDPDLNWTPGDQLKYVYGAKSVHPVGRGWSYSDTNYILLGLILEKITGKDVYELVETDCLKPNKLNATIPNRKRELQGLVPGYTNIFRGLGFPERVLDGDGRFVINPAMEWCGGGFASSAPDLARWTHVYFSGRLIEKEYLSLLKADSALAPMLGKNTRYGIGVMIRDTKLGEMLGHDGVFPGYTSTAGYFPDHDFSVALMINADGPQASGRQLHEVMIDLAKVVIEASK